MISRIGAPRKDMAWVFSYALQTAGAAGLLLPACGSRTVKAWRVRVRIYE